MIKVVCFTCQNPLDILMVTPPKHPIVDAQPCSIIEVSPCDHCMDRTWAKAYGAGREDAEDSLLDNRDKGV